MAAKISTSPLSLAFAARAEGTTSKSQTVTLSNVKNKNKKKNQTITVLSVSTTGDFAVPAGACVGQLETGHKCKVPVTFTPSATGARKGSLIVSSNASNPDLTIALSGKGKKAAK